ncbi:TPA: MBL fold metallo-hydrolase [Legionella pneumophila]|nr:MBL fold metallo-hydrolase [Legionella pneumophila]
MTAGGTMTLKITFLGSGSSFAIGPENYQSNVLLELENDTLLIDAGTDIKYSLRDQGLTYKDIKNVYISHLHYDHCGGLEWFALITYFDPNLSHKPCLIASDKIINELWDKSLSGGLSTLPHERANLSAFFDVKAVKQYEGFVWRSIKFKLVQTVHYYSEYELMPSFGLIFSYNKSRILFTSDTQSCPVQLISFYEESDIIFHDCETTESKSGVHAHYSELVKLPSHLKKKMWLYHYNPGKLPNAKKDGFLGFVAKGQSFIF